MQSYYGPRFPELSKSLLCYYLDFLGLPQEKPSFDYLNRLIDRHVRIIPWENSDLILRGHIELDVEKLVKQYHPNTKGGLCYQVNATFFALLHTLGFNVTFHPGMVFGYRHTVYKEPRLTHAVSRVRLDDQDYLADVSWGGLGTPLSVTFRAPHFYLEEREGRLAVFYTENRIDTLQYMLFNRNLFEDDIKTFINYENACEEREVAHRPMFYLFGEK